MFIASLAGCVLLVVSRAQWEGDLSLGNRAWLIDLERAPAWAPPPVPAYEQFKRTFHDLPPAETPGLEITRVMRWGWMFEEFILLVFGVTTVFGLIYLNEPVRSRDVVLHYGLSVAAGLGGAGLICLALWLIVGGWGPPLPIFFGLLGIIVGVLIGRRTYGRKAA